MIKKKPFRKDVLLAYEVIFKVSTQRAISLDGNICISDALKIGRDIRVGKTELNLFPEFRRILLTSDISLQGP